MENLKQYFLLKDGITYLNFGSFGACVKPVFERYQQFQLELEQEPVQFITGKGLKYLAAAREALAAYIHCDMDDLVYVTNPSYAVNLIAKSFPLQAGDEILTTDLEYGACDKTWDYYCRKAGARYVRQPITLPLQSADEFVADFKKGISAKTKLIFISHITSSTGLRLPVEAIGALAKEKGIPMFVDGAHAPGQIPLDLKSMPVDFYAGACHKWMMTPKGSSFLYVRKEFQAMTDPLVISWGFDALFPSSSQFLDYHQTNGTRDFSAFLTIPFVLKFMREHNWEKVAADCRKMVHDNALRFCDLLGSRPLAPVIDEFILQLFSAEIKTREPEKLHQHFYEKYRIQIPVMRHADKIYLRYSINAFNTQQDLDTLFSAIGEIRAGQELIF